MYNHKFFNIIILSLITIYSIGQSPLENCNNSYSTPNTDPNAWEEFRSYNFNEPLNLEEWTPKDNEGRWLQLQKFQKQHVYTENGNLVLDAALNNNEDITIWHEKTKKVIKAPMTSGEVTLNEKMQFGYFEAKIKLPQGPGAFPAFWMIEDFDNWTTPLTDYPNEIDIVEQRSLKNGTHVSTHADIYWDNQIWNNETKSYGARHTNIEKINQELNGWNKYAVEWSKHSIKYFLNDTLVFQHKLGKESFVGINPSRILLSLQFLDDYDNTYGDLYPLSHPDYLNRVESQKMLVDYVKIWKRKGHADEINGENYWVASNDKRIGTWVRQKNDKFISGDFDGDGESEIQSISIESNHNQTLKFSGSLNGFYSIYNGTNNIGGWIIDKENDKYVSGDFDGDSKDEILMMNHKSNWSALNNLSNTNTWSGWNNNGNDWVGGWKMSEKDICISGNFDGGMDDELFCMNYQSDYSIASKFRKNNWGTISINYGIFNSWNLSEKDQLLSGDFDGDDDDELLIFNQETGYAMLFKFKTNTWEKVWDNSDNLNFIGGYGFAWGKHYAVGDFLNIGKDQLFGITIDGVHRYILKFENGTFQTASKSVNDSDNSRKRFDNSTILTFKKNNRDYVFLEKYFNSSCENTEKYSANIVDFSNSQYYQYQNRPLGNYTLQNKSSLHIYPNPTSGTIHLNKGFEKIEVFNLEGLKLKSFVTSETVDISEFKKGIYLLKIQTINNEITFKKIQLIQ